MEPQLILGFLLALLIGISLGLIGGGGSILTVPILVYVVGISPLPATGYSLFIVGTTALVAGLTYIQKRQVEYRTVVVFGIPSIIAVYLTRFLLVPNIPEVLFEAGGSTFTRDSGIMLLFAIIMLMAAWSMVRKGDTIRHAAHSQNAEDVKPSFNYPMALAEGTVVGAVTGLVGAGGGFLIIPALVLFAGLPMKIAVGTSLLIIAAKSLIGFLGDISHQTIDWSFLLGFTAIAVAGTFLGSRWSNRVSNERLKKAFGWFVVVMGVFILVEELILH